MGRFLVAAARRVYLVTDRKACAGGDLVGSVEAALEGGIRFVQLREKDLPARELFSLASELRELTAGFGALLLVNDRLDVALASGADGVHLGVSGFTPADARRLAGPDFIIGASAHGLDEALGAEASGADFITFGPVFATPSKAPYGEPVGVAALSGAAAAVKVPVYAIGGIGGGNAATVMEAGAAGVAAISAVLGAPDARRAAALLLEAASGSGTRTVTSI